MAKVSITDRTQTFSSTRKIKV